MGLLQFLTSPFLVGWLLSVYWSYLLVKKAYKDNREVKKYLEKTEART